MVDAPWWHGTAARTAVNRNTNVAKSHRVWRGEARCRGTVATRLAAIVAAGRREATSHAALQRVVASQDCQADVIITADATMRGPKPIPLKGVADKAIELAGKNGHVVKKATRPRGAAWLRCRSAACCN
jgi:acyl-coenzyme A synthetase/AMP-(fatty) acid ligase